ncbi:PREDICTED: protein FAM32A-like [Populus euphratica]|uniref:Protein FAM32A-like n=1 Tax=Populus euphratica TaxID=75702 RepID=A0AAJ6SZW9_POPEU|nr:PREDICTED: protein FAM32A-like [Populus euphratica]XP_011013827.1 PREDICTED: protein FAM32A-like [Populus euphratica]
MSAYENVIGGKLKLKGKALDVKAGGIIKKKKNLRYKKHRYQDQSAADGNTELATDHAGDMNETDKDDEQGQTAKYDDHLTPAEKRYLQQWEKIDTQRMVKMASKSHRDRIQEFNQYLANLSEHYDIPKVGPG